MKHFTLLVFGFFLFLSFNLSAQKTENPGTGKVIFSVKESAPYILMDDTLIVTDGKIFESDTGIHTYKVWAQKHEVATGEFTIKNDVHLNRQFIDLTKGEAFKKRRNTDILVASGFAVTLPILAVLNYDFEPDDLMPYEQRIADAQIKVDNNEIGAFDELQIAQEDYDFVKKQNDDGQKKADVRQGIVAGVFVAEMIGLAGYLVYRVAGPKLKTKNPLLSGLQIQPNIGFNYQGLGMRYKF